MLVSALRLVLSIALSSIATMSAAAVRETCPVRTSDEYYFPAETFADESGRNDAFVRGWYSEQLRAMGEPSLSCGSPGRVYRFTWLRTFHHPIAVRVTDFGRRGRLDAIELDGAGGYEPGKPLRRRSFVLGKKTMGALRESMASAWDLAATEPSNGRDGAEWIIELADHGRHHAIVRWSPTRGPVRDLGLRLLEASGWKFRQSDIY
jgi:hypothetical protein